MCHWDRTLWTKHHWIDPLFGMLQEREEIDYAPIVQHRLLKWQTTKDILQFWQPIIQQRGQ